MLVFSDVNAAVMFLTCPELSNAKGGTDGV
jgi:hypothetical protein